MLKQRKYFGRLENIVFYKKKTGKDLQVAPNDQAKHHHTLPPLLLTFETAEIPPL